MRMLVVLVLSRWVWVVLLILVRMCGIRLPLVFLLWVVRLRRWVRVGRGLWPRVVFVSLVFWLSRLYLWVFVLFGRDSWRRMLWNVVRLGRSWVVRVRLRLCLVLMRSVILPIIRGLFFRRMKRWLRICVLLLMCLRGRRMIRRLLCRSVGLLGILFVIRRLLIRCGP